jgi:hypothetical protein
VPSSVLSGAYTINRCFPGAGVVESLDSVDRALQLRLCDKEREIRERELGLGILVVVVAVRKEVEGRKRMLLERARMNIVVQVSS